MIIPMTTNKTSWSFFGWVFSGLMSIVLISIILLVLAIDVIAEQGLNVFNIANSYFDYRTAWQNSTGNEFTGEVTAILFVMSNIPVGLDLISKSVLRHAPISERTKAYLRRFNNLQRKKTDALPHVFEHPRFGNGDAAPGLIILPG